MAQNKPTRLPFAALAPSQQAARNEQAAKEAQSAAALVQSLQELRHHLMVAMPHYVYSDTFVFGGTTTALNNPLRFTSPFQTPAQYQVLNVAFGGAGTAYIGPNRGQAAPAITASVDPSAQTSGQLYAAGGETTVPGAETWIDIPGNAEIFLAVSAGANAAWATIQFRRRVSPAGLYAEGHS